MHSWPIPDVPVLPDPAPELRLYDTADDAVKPVDVSGGDSGEVGMYVCGITPYDSTHLGHAATYLAFDLVHRYLTTAGHSVHYVQNITDVDDPLFERAERDGVDWRDLGTDQINLFRSDMGALQVIPPRDYVGAMESIDEVVEMTQKLLDAGAAYQLTEDEYPDIYADRHFTQQFGYESRYDQATMEQFFAERGGDPDRPGKKDPLDALLWRAHREGEPQWDAPFGAGRPGWHVECSAIATRRLGTPFAIQGGGNDLRFPHHEFSAAHAEAATGEERMAGHYVHTGMIALDGTKMSKSLGNLVFVHKLTEAGHEPSAIRLGVFAGHYRDNRDWSDAILAAAEERLARWRGAVDAVRGAEVSEQALADSRSLIADVRACLSNDLNTPAALDRIDQWAELCLQDAGQHGERAESAAQAVELATSVRTGLNALLGLSL
ncbi:cysteine--1-D-myo-inosityl 2-amino-2-deoxy-alpha-D-glucopyranoside ligase [Corynebacterium sp. 320]|uniref:cysteine--1-D-myo-inosityl 2-amino-2-deoxy-alpha-D-glucopyranoside ligase n=1 Tax=Corynebacterium TaxID=1716 RepID=UPI00125CC9F8|nr:MULTISPECIES: cysteine--1-D-myo-inosityl 2-amino-2-deoxy-alpha-D-glucopyranoside ligase [Corynebacterium]KAB1503643.1 cysteine--1-D-myo-inosityl 2-amino-2-deoxy-alpha-D-glucopyranoside ligase [Corynebacterium sp. 320]KAB1553256.1 cysteine--1-D-myo-inosityl 2-amino-2-deoxy-alpha-D-glucopyranoside ligase [Corynebacterium sp. 321]KAB1553525.1 cysteine--1-D-myo-inosityl 2-amino-2-deoxy-alpha-D-glucopyranoside ligase [Corynebacterium sp. 319]KAB3527779.1 cysteine--1-D-myo-inosityl 2-amino-2-deoxy